VSVDLQVSETLTRTVKGTGPEQKLGMLMELEIGFHLRTGLERKYDQRTEPERSLRMASQKLGSIRYSAHTFRYIPTDGNTVKLVSKRRTMNMVCRHFHAL
jgi:hypothetical protein